MLTRKELTSILKQFETGNYYHGTRIELCDDNVNVAIWCMDYFEGGHYYWQEPEYMESLDKVYSIKEIANEFSKSHSAYWQELANELLQWYYAHVKWDEYSKSKECLDFMCEHFKDLSFMEAEKLMKSVFYTKQQLYKTESQIKDINNELDSCRLSEDDVISALEAWRDLDIDKTHLEWELNILLNK